MATEAAVKVRTLDEIAADLRAASEEVDCAYSAQRAGVEALGRAVVDANQKFARLKQELDAAVMGKTQEQMFEDFQKGLSRGLV